MNNLLENKVVRFAPRVFDQLESLLDRSTNVTGRRLVRVDQFFDGVDGRASQRLGVGVVRRVDRSADMGSKPNGKAAVERDDGSLGPVVDHLVDGVQALMVDVGLADVLSEDWNYGDIATLRYLKVWISRVRRQRFIPTQDSLPLLR